MKSICARCRSALRSESGQILPITLGLLALGALIVGPFLTNVGTALRGSQQFGQTSMDGYARDAGVEYGIWQLTDAGLQNSLGPGNSSSFDLPNTVNGSTPNITVTNTSSGSTGMIGSAPITSAQFNTTAGYRPRSVQVGTGVFAVAYRGASNYGNVTTFQVNNAGSIVNANLDTYAFTTSAAYESEIIPVSGTVYAVAYRDSSNRGVLRTMNIASNGTITHSSISNFTFDSTAAYEPDLVQVSSTVFGVVYRGSSNRGNLKTVSIAANGTISGTLATLRFDNTAGYTPAIRNVSGTTYAIAYRGSGNNGRLATVSISSNGTTLSNLRSFTFDSGGSAYEPSLALATGSYFAIAYRGGSNDLYLATLSIDASGNITAVDSQLGDGVQGYEPNLYVIGSGVCAIAYRGATNHGFLKTWQIAADGTIGSAAIDSLDFDGSGYTPLLVRPYAGIYGIAFTGSGNHGYLKTITISETVTFTVASALNGLTTTATVSIGGGSVKVVSWATQ